MANVYDGADDGILAFIHMEFRWHVSEPDGDSTVGDVGCYFRFGLAHSTDGGATAGCVAIDDATLVKIMQWLRPGAMIAITE